MPERVERDFLVAETRAAMSRCGQVVLGGSAVEPATAEPTAARGREQWAGGFSSAFGESAAQDGEGRGCQRSDPLLSALSSAADVRAGRDVNLTAGEPGQLGGTEPGPDRRERQRVVAPAGRDCAAARGEKSVDLVRIQERDEI